MKKPIAPAPAMPQFDVIETPPRAVVRVSRGFARPG
jgi:hypothetical protein